MGIFCGRKCKKNGNSVVGSFFQSVKNEVKHASSDVGEGIKNVVDKIGDITDIGIKGTDNIVTGVTGKLNQDNGISENIKTTETTGSKTKVTGIILGITALVIGVILVINKKRKRKR